MLALLAGVLVAVFLSVKVSLESDTLSDLRNAASAATSFAQDQLVARDGPESLAPANRRGDSDDKDGRRREGSTDRPESSSDDLSRAFPIFVFGSSGELIFGTASLKNGLPDYVSLRASGPSSEDVRTISSEEGPVRVLSRSIIVDGKVAGTLQVATSVSAERRALTVLIVVLAAVGGVAAATAGVAGYFLSNRAMRPIRVAFTRQQEFIADAAHELRTPVAVIGADADALARVQEQLPEDDRKLLEDLQKESRFIGDVVGKLLQVTRLDAGAESTTPGVFDLRELTSDVAATMSRIADPRGIAIAPVPDGPSIHVLADRVQVRLVLMSILDNAIKYNRPDGAVSIKASRSSDRGIIEIEDTGHGIPPEDADRVFSRFYRVDRARSRSEGGVGLGLSIAKAVMEANGGSISLRSVVGEGTTVEISLPVGPDG